jgi:GntR family transcriptional regulator, arabinose operon transcriptional repressor
MKSLKTNLRRDEAQPALQSTRLKYQQVKDYVLQQIADGHLKSGDVLPPEKILAKKLNRGVHAVRHALDELSEEKVVRRVRGKGTLVNSGKGPPAPRQKLDILALILPEVGVGLYPSLIKGFIEAAAESHHQVLTCNCGTISDTHVQSDVILQLLNKKNLGGVAIVPTLAPMPSYQLEVLHAHGIPVVFCHRRPEGLAAPLITWPWEEVGRRAGEAIIGSGHRNIAFVGAGRYEVSTAYLKGLRDVLAQHGLELPDDRVLFNMEVKAPPAEDTAHSELAAMLQATNHPTAVFCTDTTEAERVFLEAIKLGLRVPDDLAIIGFGCRWREGVLSQRITAVTIDEVDLGRRVAILLGQMQAGGQAIDSDEIIRVPVGFSEGQSLGSVRV